MGTPPRKKLMTENVDAFGATGQARVKTTGGEGRAKPSVSVERPSIEVVNFLMAAVRAGNGVAEYPVLASNAQRVDDLVEAVDDDNVLDLLEGLQEAGVETVSLEDFFGVDLEGEGVEFVGTPPLLNQKHDGEFDELDDETKELYNDDDIYSYGDPDNGKKAYILKPDWLEIEREGRINDTVINMVNYALNGYWYPEIKEAVDGENPTRFKVQIGRSYNHQDDEGNTDEFSKRRHVAFTFETSETTDERIVSAAYNVGTISEETVEGFDAGEVDLDDIAEEIRENRD